MSHIDNMLHASLLAGAAVAMPLTSSACPCFEQSFRLDLQRSVPTLVTQLLAGKRDSLALTWLLAEKYSSSCSLSTVQ